MAQHALDRDAPAARRDRLSWLYLGVGLLDLAAVLAGLFAIGCVANSRPFLGASLIAGGCAAPLVMLLIIGTRISYRRHARLSRNGSIRLLAAFALALLALFIFFTLGLATYNCAIPHLAVTSLPAADVM